MQTWRMHVFHHIRLAHSRRLSISSPGSNHKWHHPENGFPTGISVYNCVARKHVPIVLRQPNCATWYSCGPTVYDAAHLGHASSFVRQDILQKILRDYFHINLVTAMNITDVDDKIIERSAASGEHWKQLTMRNEADFWTDLQRLGCAHPNVVLRVSEHIPQIVAFIQRLLDQGFAYVTNDGSVYFEVNKLASYGKLQRLSTDLDGTEYEFKRSAGDFALWKGQRSDPTTNAAAPHWSTPWSSVGGRPGWHIECSAMASHVFGPTVDFHSGGMDLRFPHHENEEAQSCAHHDCQQWVNYWIHTGQLHVLGDQAKMSKSLNNTIGVSRYLESNSVAEFRMYCLLANYQNPMEFGKNSMDVSRAILKRLKGFAHDCQAFVQGSKPIGPFSPDDIYAKLTDTTQKVDTSLRHNFNTSKSVEHILELIAFANKSFGNTSNLTLSQGTTSATPDLGAVLAVRLFVEKFERLFGIHADRDKESVSAAPNPDNRAERLSRIVDGVLEIRGDIRQRAVASKNAELFRASDNLRDLLKNAGICVQDTVGQASTWTVDDRIADRKNK